MPDTIEATSPAIAKGDAKVGSGNLSVGQAAAQLFASAKKEAPPVQASQAAAETTPETSETTPETAAEAQVAPESAETTETQAAETTEAAPETGEDADAVHSQTISFTPEQQEIFNRRLGKEIAKTKALQAQAEAASARATELEARLNQRTEEPEAASQATVPVVVMGNQPLPNVNDFTALAQTRQTAKEAIRYVENILDDPDQWKSVNVPDPQGMGNDKTVKVHQIGDKLYTETDLKRSMREAKVTLEDHIPAREQFLSARQQAQKVAHTEFPWLLDKKAPEYQHSQAIRNDPRNAWINAQPNADMIIGIQIEGLKAIAARKAAADATKNGGQAAKPKIAPAKPPADQTVVSTSGAASRQPIGSDGRNSLNREMARLSKKGGINSDEAASLLRKSELLRKSR